MKISGNNYKSGHGMKTNWDDFNNGIAFRDWTTAWGKEAYRVLRPGGSILSFGGARQYHHMASGLEAAGFHTKDMIEWLYYTGMPKSGRQLKPTHEPIYWGIKPPISAMTINVDRTRIPPQAGAPELKARGESKASMFWHHENNPAYNPSKAGRFPTNSIISQRCDPADKECQFLKIGEMANVIEIPKPQGAERAAAFHPTTKPENLMRWLGQLVTNKGDLIVDPFVGGGTTCAANPDRRCIGMELDRSMAHKADHRVQLSVNAYHAHPSDFKLRAQAAPVPVLSSLAGMRVD
jgi:site-specific DNA-methyltransferase (adenine-specific)